MDPSTAPALALLTHLDPQIFETKAILKTASAGRQLAELPEALTDSGFLEKSV